MAQVVMQRVSCHDTPPNIPNVHDSLAITEMVARTIERLCMLDRKSRIPVYLRALINSGGFVDVDNARSVTNLFISGHC